MQRWVAVLDAIGWQETGEDDLVIDVDGDMAMWALGQAVELEIACQEGNIPWGSMPTDALSGLRTIAEAA